MRRDGIEVERTGGGARKTRVILQSQEGLLEVALNVGREREAPAGTQSPSDQIEQGR